ncbi:MAG: 3-oxoacyl-[acyl-carrier-protein] synthase, KASII, partial [uncultured Gemmatimonadetes bacterium]
VSQGSRHRGRNGHAAGVLGAGNMGRAPGRTERRGGAHQVRASRARAGGVDRGGGEGVLRRAGDRPQGGAPDGHLHPVRHRRDGRGDEERGVRGDRHRAGPGEHRRHHRLGDGRAREHHGDPRPDRAEGDGARVALLHPRQHHQPGRGAGGDPHRRAGAQLRPRLRLRQQQPRHRRGVPRHPARRRGHDDRRGHRGVPHPHLLRGVRGGAGAGHHVRRARDGEPAVRRHAQRLRARRGRRHPGDGGAGVRAPARRAHRGGGAGLRDERRRLPHHRAPRERRGRRARHAPRPQERRHRARAGGLRQRPRHLHARRRPGGDAGHPRRLRRARGPAGRVVHQVHAGPRAGRQRRHRGRRRRLRPARGHPAAHHQPARAGPGVRPGLRAQRGSPRPRRDRHLQLVRLRRCQHVSRPGPLERL